MYRTKCLKKCRGVQKKSRRSVQPKTFQNFMFQNKPSQPEPRHVFFFSTVVIGEKSKGLRKPFKNNRPTLLPVTKDHLRQKQQTESSPKGRFIRHQTLNCSLSQFCLLHIVCHTVFPTSRLKNVVAQTTKSP